MAWYMIVIAIVCVGLLIYRNKSKKAVEEVPQGLQTFDGTGKLTLDITDYLTRRVGDIYLNTRSGSATLNVQDPNRVWMYLVAQPGASLSMGCYVSIYKNGASITWSYEDGVRDPSNPAYPYILKYGEY